MFLHSKFVQTPSPSNGRLRILIRRLRTRKRAPAVPARHLSFVPTPPAFSRFRGPTCTARIGKQAAEGGSERADQRWKRADPGKAGEMNAFRLAGDMTHLISVLVLLLKIHTIKSCAGESPPHPR